MLTPIPVAQSVVPVEIQPPIATPLVPVEPATNLLWKKKFPTIFSGILAFLQYGITVVIIGCEIGTVLIDVFTATIYVGFWASIFFVSAWISQASSSKFDRSWLKFDLPQDNFQLVAAVLDLVQRTR